MTVGSCGRVFVRQALAWAILLVVAATLGVAVVGIVVILKR